MEFFINDYHQAIEAIDLIESKIYKSLTSKSKKPPQNMCSIFFENKGVEFINMARILRDPDIVKSLPSSSVKFLILRDPDIVKSLPSSSVKFLCHWLLTN